MSSTALALSTAGGAASAGSPLNRCAVVSSSALNTYTKSPSAMSKKILIFPSSSSSTVAADHSSLKNHKMMITSELPMGRYCYLTVSASILTRSREWRTSISCEVALRSTNSATSSLSSSSTSVTEGEDEKEELQRAENMIEAKVRVKVPLRVYHVPRVSEVDLNGKEGHLMQYVGLWKRKRISANLPYKIRVCGGH